MHPDMNPALDEEGKRRMARSFADLAVAWKWIEQNHEHSEIIQTKMATQQRARVRGNHPQDKKPVVPKGKYAAQDTTDNTAAKQAKEYILEKQRLSRGGAEGKKPAAEKQPEIKRNMKMPPMPKRRGVSNSSISSSATDAPHQPQRPLSRAPLRAPLRRNPIRTPPTDGDHNGTTETI
eukprot:TRINITY_DN2485_c0_g1_i2.p2 TRINITY_DN2485_c0_g1~~TRINITY_DN2485_c0_g1_i2.p2  ORF type:complete len:178 (+),score=23.64 TRINITY_DN2485_c0_g1_i2:805-1338(+)